MSKFQACAIGLLFVLGSLGCGPSVAAVDRGADGDGGVDSGVDDEPGTDGPPSGEDGPVPDGDGTGDVETGADETGNREPDCTDALADLIPTYQALQEDVIERSCSPFGAVCHAGQEYPDLDPPHGLLGAVGAPCNLGHPDAISDACELVPDRLRISADGETHVADVARHAYDPQSDVMTVELRAGPDFDAGELATLEVAGPDEAWMLVPTPIFTEADSSVVQLLSFSTMASEPRNRMQALAAGDPNANEIYGAQAYGYLEVTAGDPYASYLFLTLLGEVGTVPMPLANKSLSEEELAAIACWIEGLTVPGGDQPDAEIDYVNCEYAQSELCG